MWRIIIDKVENGYILTMPEEQENIVPNKENDPTITIVNKQEVIEAIDRPEYVDREYKTNDEEKIAMAKMLESVADYFGTYYEKHNEENLNIDFGKKGSKCEEE